MKLAILAAFAAVATSSTSLAADINVIGARTTADMQAPMVSDASVNVVGAQDSSPKTTDARTDVRIASKDLLNRATALLNKNTLATDNNVFIARSNIVFTQNDRLALRKKVEDVLKRAKDQEQDMTSATLTKNVMRAVSAPDTDSALMTKASGVVAAAGDPTALMARIADFVDAAGKQEMEQEQAIQSQTPRGVLVLVGTKDLLRQPTGVVNKGIAASDNQIAISRSTLDQTQNDQVVLTGGAKVADAVLPAAVSNVGQKVTTDTDTESGGEPMYRMRVAFPKEGDADAALKDAQEMWLGGFGGLGWGLGWRYPLGYWNTWGAGIYGGGCGLGFPHGGFFYC